MKRSVFLLFLGISLFILFSGGILAFASYRNAERNEKQLLLDFAQTISASLETQRVASLIGTEADLENAQYQALKEKLIQVREANPRLYFIYLMGDAGNKQLFFYVDSEPADSEDYSPPGEVYIETSPELYEAYVQKQPFTEGPVMDRWGNWISALVPLAHTDSMGRTVILGIDIDANAYQAQLARLLLLYALVIFTLEIVVWGYYFYYRKQKVVDAAKSEFVSLASHQLGTPLTTINWQLEPLLDESLGSLTDNQRKALQEVAAASERMGVLVSDLLSVSRLEMGTFTGNPERVSLSSMLEKAIHGQQMDLGKKELQVTSEIESGLPQIVADAHILQMVFDNLLSNAIKYTPPKGSIAIKLTRKKEGIEFVIADSGYGIPKSQQHKVFQKLFRAENVKAKEAQGTGLGLYIVKKIVDEMKGKIWFESEENRGTTFHVVFPL